MTDSDRQDAAAPDNAGPPMSNDLHLDGEFGGRIGTGLAPNEAFQRLASDVRLSILVHLLRAERNEEGALPFSELQDTVGSDSSAGFAYHLRQLSGHFVRKEADGYVLTAAGRRAAVTVLSGAFTTNGDRRAS